jgi:hypothetical protein
MARSLFAANVATAHRSISAMLSPASDARGRKLMLWWPATNLANRREVTEMNFHSPPIVAFIGPTKRDAVAAAGLTVSPQRTMTFAAELKDFPTGNLPRTGVCFLAGPAFEEATFYRCTAASTVAGLVEIEASVEP